MEGPLEGDYLAVAPREDSLATLAEEALEQRVVEDSLDKTLRHRRRLVGFSTLVVGLGAGPGEASSKHQALRVSVSEIICMRCRNYSLRYQFYTYRTP